MLEHFSLASNLRRTHTQALKENHNAISILYGGGSDGENNFDEEVL